MKVQKKLALAYLRNKLNLLSVINKRKAGQEAFRLFCTPLQRYNGKEAEIFANAEKLELQLGKGIVRGYRCNAPQARKVLLLHGFSSTCHKFDKYAKALVDMGYEVLAFDAPAHGASSGTTINAVEYKDMIKKVVETFGPIDAYIAHSFGGIAVSLALEELPHNKETRVVLIAPATETTSAIAGAFAILGITSKHIRSSIDEIIFNLSGKETEWFSIRRAIKNIRAAVLWIHDEHDDVTPITDALKVKEEAPANVQFFITSGLGHQRIYRDQVVRDEILRFLQADLFP